MVALVLLIGGCAVKVGGPPGPPGPGGGGGADAGTTGTVRITKVTVPASVAAGDALDVEVTVTNDDTSASYGKQVTVGLSRHGAPFVSAMTLTDQGVMNPVPAGATVTFTVHTAVPGNFGAGDDDVWVRLGTTDYQAPSPDLGKAEIEVTGATCPADPLEPNDSRATANVLTLDTPQHHTTCSEGIDWLRFSGHAGQRYALVVTGDAASPGNPDDVTTTVFQADGHMEIPVPYLQDVRFRIFTAVTDDTLIRVGDPREILWPGPDVGYTAVMRRAGPDWRTAQLTETDPRSATDGQAVDGGRMEVSFYVENGGDKATGPVTVGVYLGTGGQVGPGDLKLGQVVVDPLDTDGSVFKTLTIAIPASLAPGAYTLGLITDPTNAVAEIDEDDNLETTPVQVVAPPCAPDAYEEDDTRADANPIALSVTQTHNFCDDDTDWLAFDVPAAGVDYVVEDPGDWPIELVAPDQTVAAKANGPGSTPTPVLPFTPGLAGTWHLRLGDGTDPATDTYTVRIDPKAPNLAARLPTPLGQQYAMAGGFYAIEASVKNLGFLDSGAYQVSFVASTDTVLDAGDQTLLTERRPSLAPGATDQLAPDLSIPGTLAPGTWYLFVVADPGNQVVETDETDNVSPPLNLQVQAPLCAPDGYEEDDTLADANPVTLGTPQAHNQCDDGMDWVRFDATAGAGYLVQMAFTTIAVSDQASAYDASGTLIAGPAVASGAGFWFQAPATGACALELGQQRWGAPYASTSGDYTLHVDRCDADAYEPDDTMADAAPIAVGDTQQHNACDPAHPDWQVFDATAGTTYTVSTGVVGPTIDTVVTLEDATGAVLVTNDDAKRNSRYSQATWTATYTGKVYVKVDAKAGAGLNSEYTVTLQ